MANHRAAAALLLIASLFLAVAISRAEARTTVRPNKMAALRRDTRGRGYVAEVAAPPEPESEPTCKKVHGVQAGETCCSVGEGAGLTQDQFLGFNPNLCCEKLFVGQWVCLEATSGCHD